MATYVVMEPAGDRTGESALYVRDALAPLAIVLPVVWLLWHRLWLEAAMVFFAMLGAAAVLDWIGMPQLAGLTAFLTGMYVALEGSALRMTAARRKGFAEKAVIDAVSRDEAEENHLLTRHTVKDSSRSGQIRPLERYSLREQNVGVFAMPGST